jgi:hypothetical protein
MRASTAASSGGRGISDRSSRASDCGTGVRKQQRSAPPALATCQGRCRPGPVKGYPGDLAVQPDVQIPAPDTRQSPPCPRTAVARIAIGEGRTVGRDKTTAPLAGDPGRKPAPTSWAPKALSRTVKYWAPSSTERGAERRGQRAVAIRPPGRRPFSRRMVCMPAAASVLAACRPARPAPTIRQPADVGEVS